MEEQGRTFIYYRESLFQSIMSDMFTFGCILAVLFINQIFFTGKWYVDIIMLFMLYTVIVIKSLKHAKIFTDMKELKKYIKSL